MVEISAFTGSVQDFVKNLSGHHDSHTGMMQLTSEAIQELHGNENLYTITHKTDIVGFVGYTVYDKEFHIIALHLEPSWQDYLTEVVQELELHAYNSSCFEIMITIHDDAKKDHLFRAEGFHPTDETGSITTFCKRFNS